MLPLPLRGETFLDPRGEGRSLRVSGHPDAGTVVLSVWRHGECCGTFRIEGGQIDALVRALLAAAPPAAPSTGPPPEPHSEPTTHPAAGAESAGEAPSGPLTHPGDPEAATG